MSARETAELLLQVGRLVQAEGYDGELSPAQWMALRFLARANPFSRTPSAFAEFQATTRGTATQAVKALEAGGYLVRQPFKTDGAKRKSATDEQGQKSTCTRSVRSSGARRGFARRDRANCDASRAAPSAVHSSYEWCASADRCLPGLHALRQREWRQPAEHGPLGR